MLRSYIIGFMSVFVFDNRGSEESGLSMVKACSSEVVLCGITIMEWCSDCVSEGAIGDEPLSIPYGSNNQS